MFEPCPLAAALTAALPASKLAPVLLLIMRRLGADDLAARPRRGSEEFGPLDTMPQHQQAADRHSSPRMPQPPRDGTSRSKAAREALVSDDCAFGLEGVGSLGRRRTSTMKAGTARLNVVLDIAHGSADSPRLKRPCEAKRSKAIGYHYGGRHPVISTSPGVVTGTVAHCASAGNMGHDDLVRPPPVPARGRSRRRLALRAFQRSAFATSAICSLSAGRLSPMKRCGDGLEVRAVVCSRTSPSAPSANLALASR